MAKLVTIFGGTGFLGRYVARRMALAGWQVRVATRCPKDAGVVRTYGAVGQVEPVPCNIRDDASTAQAMIGADAVINCVGILEETGRNKFAAVQFDGAERVARLAAEAKVARLVHISAIGADPESSSAYARSKAQGEMEVLARMPDAVILRPSVIFGAEDQFFNRFAEMARFSPVLPLVGAQTRFQPVWVDDVAEAACRAAEGRVASGTYELGGPEVATFRELMLRMLQVIRRRRLILDLPFWLGAVMGGAFGLARKLSFGLLPAPITRDQVRALRRDNVVAERAPGFAALGIAPVAMGAVLDEYLWRFRPDGQYDATTASTADLKREA